MQHLFSAGDDCKLWTSDSFQLITSGCFHSSTISSLSYYGQAQLVATTSYAADAVSITSVVDDAFVPVSSFGDQDKISTCRFFNRIPFLLTGGQDSLIRLWDWKSRSCKKTYKGNAAPVTCISVSSTDSHFVSGSATGEVRLFLVTSGESSLMGSTAKSAAVRFIEHSPLSRSMLASCADDGSVSLWNSGKSKKIHQFCDHLGPATGLAFSPVNDMLMISVGLDKKCFFHDVTSKKTIESINVDSALTSVAMHSNGYVVALGTSRGAILFYDLRNSSAPTRVIHDAHKCSISALKFQQPKHASVGKHRASSQISSASSREIEGIDEDEQRDENSNQIVAKEAVSRRNSTGSSRSIFSPLSNGGHHERSSTSPRRAKEPERQAEPARMYPSDRVAVEMNRLPSRNGFDEFFSPTASDAASNCIRESLNKSPFLSFLTPSVRSPGGSKVLSADFSAHLSDSGGSGASQDQGSSSQPSTEERSAPSASSDVTKPEEAAGNLSPEQFVKKYIKEAVEECIDDFRTEVRRTFVRLHSEMLWMFQRHEATVRDLIQSHSVNNDLLQEIQRLREENDRFRRTF